MPTWEPETLNEKEETAIERRVKADIAAEEDLCLPEPADIPAENRCGYGPCCKTDSVQKCNSPGYMLMCVTWFTFAQGQYNKNLVTIIFKLQDNNVPNIGERLFLYYFIWYILLTWFTFAKVSITQN